MSYNLQKWITYKVIIISYTYKYDIFFWYIKFNII